jgi:hypothetical protein
MADVDKDSQTLKKLLETIQDVFIFQSLEAGHTKDTIRNLLRVDQVRVTRISKLRPKAKRTNQ